MIFQQIKYHALTKHSYNSVRINPNRVDWDNPPNRFKYYPKEFKRVSLNQEDEIFDFLYSIAGITAKKSYPGMEYYLRVNPSAGALYPNEIYFQVRNEKSLVDGIYHFEVGSSSLTLLRELNNDEGIESNLDFNFLCDGFIFFISSIYYRSSWKYKNRALRYCLLDAGHLLGSIEASSYLYNKSFKTVFDFDKMKLNELFCFDEKEFFTSCVICGTQLAQRDLNKVNLEIPTVDGTAYDGNSYLYEVNPAIKEAYLDTLKITNKKQNLKTTSFNFNKEYFKDVIFKRRSIREFFKKSIKKVEFESILNNLNDEFTTDCNEVVNIFYVVNRVEDMKMGLYKNGNLIKAGEESKKAGYLCLEQTLGSYSAVTFFLVTRSLNYQEAYQKAGLIGHRLYLSSNYLNIGCSGIGAYYDDEVCEFIGEQYMVLYALAIGN